MKLTKLKALELTRDLWNWLSKDKNRVKSAWPRWRFNGGNVPEMCRGCPCCQFAGGTPTTASNRDCNQCPMIDYWSKFTGGEGVPCTVLTSPYRLWDCGHRETFNAKRIANAASKAIRELKK